MSNEPLSPTARVGLEMTDQTVQQAWDDFASNHAMPNVDGDVANEKHHRRNRRNHPTPST